MSELRHSTSLSPRFLRQIGNLIRYWQQKTSTLSDESATLFDAERQNIYRVLQYGLAVDSLIMVSAELILQLFRLIEQQGYQTEWIPVLHQTIRTLPRAHTATRAKLLNHLDYFQNIQRLHNDAKNTIERSIAICKAHIHTRELGEAYFYLANTFYERQQYKQAQEYSELALNIFTKYHMTDKRKMGAANNLLGIIAQYSDNHEKAKQYYHKAIIFWRQGGELVYLARAWSNMGSVLTSASEYKAAFVSYDEADKVLKWVNSPHDQTMVINGRGTIYAQAQNWKLAEKAYKKAYRLARQRPGAIYDQALTAMNVGSTLIEQQHWEEASWFLQAAIDLWKQTDDKLLLLFSELLFSSVYAGQGKTEKAIIQLKENLTHFSHFSQTNNWSQQQYKRFSALQRRLLDNSEKKKREDIHLHASS